MTTPRTTTTKRGTGNAKRATVRRPPATVDPPKPAGIRYQTLDQDKAHGQAFEFTWSLGRCTGKGRRIQCQIAIDEPANWAATNIVTIDVPAFEGLQYGGRSVRFHKLAAAQFKAFFAAVEAKGLKSHIMTQVGAYVPRTITGNPRKLSNHAIGTAIDINAAWNGFAAQPARRGTTGSVSALADFCADFGIYWGGWYSGSKDGMHFEAVDLMTEAELRSACRTHRVDFETQIRPLVVVPPPPPPPPPHKAH